MIDRLRRIHLLVEGQTEEIVVNNVLGPYLTPRGWAVTTSLVTTKRPASGPAHKGGVTKWAKLELDIRLLLQDSSLDVLTTLFDYYAFPPDSPGMDTRPIGTPYERVGHVEEEVHTAIANQRFLPHLVLHELETWVFAAADQLGSFRAEPDLAKQLKSDVAEAGGPELVNEDPSTAPSKRLAAYCRGYTKTFDGPLAIAELGINRLRAQCPHFDQWLNKLDDFC
jgi:hypothetical protein